MSTEETEAMNALVQFLDDSPMEKAVMEKAVNDLLASFWTNQMDEDEMDDFAAILRKWIPIIPSDLPSATVIGRLKRHPITRECIQDLVNPYACQMMYDGSCVGHPFLQEMIKAFSPDTFAGHAPEGHPAPHLFAGDKIHVYLPEYGMHQGKYMTFRFAETGKKLMKEKFG